MHSVPPLEWHQCDLMVERKGEISIIVFTQKERLTCFLKDHEKKIATPVARAIAAT
jgi:hypothetical protein